MVLNAPSAGLPTALVDVLLSFHFSMNNDCGPHERVDRTVVSVDARSRKRMRICLVGVQRTRDILPIIGSDVMQNILLVCPEHLRSNSNFQVDGCEREGVGLDWDTW